MTVWKQTITGVAYDMENPHPHMVRSMDISHSLAFTNRYGGHVRFEYSTAEHSVLMARYFLKLGEWGLAQQALVHDAHEAYVGDLHGPSKKLIAGWEEFEAKHEAVLRAALGLPRDFDPRVKEVDARILLDERRVLLPPPPQAWDVDAMGLEPLGVHVEGFKYKARADFDHLARGLGIQVNGRCWEAW